MVGRAYNTFLVACGAPVRGVQSFLPQEFGRELLQRHFREIQVAEVSALHTKMWLLSIWHWSREALPGPGHLSAQPFQ